MNQNIEELIALLRAEMERAIRSENENLTRDGRLAWYWSYIGALDMAHQLGLITDERLQELYEEVEPLKGEFLKEGEMRPDKQKEIREAVIKKPRVKPIWVCLDGEKVSGIIVPADSDLVKLADSWKSILAKNHPGKEVTIKEG